MENKLIRDSIHGYIQIPSIVVSEIIDTPVFQRLRQIEQTSMRALYPSAHHDRFVHSLGVYHLGKMAYAGLIHNIKYFQTGIYNGYEVFWECCGKCFELACLLHDCAHAPMSHSFEYGYLDADNFENCQLQKERLLKSMSEGLNEADEAGEKIVSQLRDDIEAYFSNPKKIAPHEMVSAILVGDYFGKKGNIKRILDELLEIKLSDFELSEYISFMQRAIIGLPYGDTLEDSPENRLKNSLKNCLISLLNGSFFDVDKLDYIVRDTIESGANNLSIDIPRILNALTLVEVNHFETSTNVNDLILNHSIYLTGCDSSVMDRGENSDCECALNLSGVRLKGKFQGELESTDINNRLKTPNYDGPWGGKISFPELTDIEATFQDTCKMAGRFNGHIEILGYSDFGKIDGLLNAKMSGNITGIIIGHIDNVAKSKITYTIGYEKTALSVIEDTLIARNRLYLWIYAHHKVTCTDYLMRQAVLYSLLDETSEGMDEFEKHKKANERLREMMCIDQMFFLENASANYLLSDGDLIYRMKQHFVKNRDRNPYAERWLNRTHLYPIWKSYIEYNNFFANLSTGQKKKLWVILFNGFDGAAVDQNLPNEANTIEFENSILREFSDEYTYVWIKPAGFKLKEMDVSNIHIVLSDNSVKRLKDVISQAKVTEQYVDDSFFYLYTTEKFDPEKKLQLVSFLKTKLKKMQ